MTFAVGHIVMFFVDRHLQPKVLEKLKERIRKLELKGFQQKLKVKKLIVKRDYDGKIIFKRNKVVEEEVKKDGDKKPAKDGKGSNDKNEALLEGELESTPVT